MADEDRRLYLHSLLVALFPDLTIFYRPSGNMRLERPCLVYEPKAREPSWANNSPFVVGSRFQITILSDRPGYTNSELVFSLSSSGIVVTSNNTYTSNDIVHDVFVVSVNTI